MAGPSCAITAELKLESSTRPQATNTITEWARALLLARRAVKLILVASSWFELLSKELEVLFL